MQMKLFWCIEDLGNSDNATILAVAMRFRPKRYKRMLRCCKAPSYSLYRSTSFKQTSETLQDIGPWLASMSNSDWPGGHLSSEWQSQRIQGIRGRQDQVRDHLQSPLDHSTWLNDSPLWLAAFRTEEKTVIRSSCLWTRNMSDIVLTTTTRQGCSPRLYKVWK